MDKPTFEGVVSEHGDWIRRTLLSLGVRASDVDDVMQEVLRGVVRGLEAFDPSLAAVPEGAVRSWLFGICERQAASYRRRKRRRAEDCRDIRGLDGFDSGSPTPETAFMTCEHKARLHDILGSMEPNRLAVIVAYELEGIPMVDVARTLGICLNTAWNRLRLARGDIKAAWDRPRPKKPS